MNLYPDMKKTILVLGKNDELLSQNVNEELFLVAEGQSSLNVANVICFTLSKKKKKKRNTTLY
jgi:hypothetical protein